MSASAIILRLMMVVPDHFKTQEMYNEAVQIYTPDCFKTQGICKEAVAHNPYALRFIPGHLKM